MATTVAEIQAKLDLATGQFDAGMAAAENKIFKFAESARIAGAASGSALAGALGNISSVTGQMGAALGGVASSIEAVFDKVKIGGLIFGGVLALMGKASIDMVMSVQRSTLALSAYTGSAESASKITQELIAYAKSPQGVLFNRDELLKTATLLKGAGLETEKLTGFIKGMAPAVAVSGRAFSEIGQILSKVISTGKLGAVEFDQLAERGIVLDKSLRGTAVSADQLQEALQKAVPASVLDKQAQTIEGRLTRLKTAFRELGNQLLGVDYGGELGASFKPGSLGDTALKSMEQFTALMKEPAIKQGFAEIGNTIKTVFSIVTPLIVSATRLIITNFDSITYALMTLGGLWAAAKVGMVVFNAISLVTAAATHLLAGGFRALSIAMFGNPFGLIVAAIAAVVGALVFLELKFGILTKLFNNVIKPVGEVIYNFLKPAFDAFVKTLTDMWNWINANIIPVLRMLWAEFIKIWTALVVQLKPAFDQLMAALEPYWPMIQKIMIAFAVLAALIVGVVIVAILLIAAIVITVVTVIVKTIQFLQGVWNAIWGAISSVVSSVWNFIKGAVTDGVSFISAIISGGVRFILGVWNGIRGMIGAAAGAIGGVVNTISGGINAAVGAVRGAIGAFIGAGADIVHGIARGISGAAGAVFNAIKGVVGDAVSFAKRILGIGSPSKVFAMEIGLPMSQGIAQGIDSGSGLVGSSLSDVTNPGQVNNQSGVTKSSPEIHIHMEGVMARSEADLREVGAQIVDAVNRGLKSRNSSELIPNIPV